MIIEVVQVLADHSSSVSFVVDQQSVAAFLAQAASPAFDETVRPRYPWRAIDGLDGLGGEHLIERGRVLAVPITDQKPEPADPLAQVHHEVTGLLDHPGVVRMRGDPEQVDTSVRKMAR